MDLKLSAREYLAAGESYEEKMQFLVDAGYDAIEITGRPDLLEVVGEIADASRATGCVVSTICSGGRGALMAAEPQARQEAVADLKMFLTAAAQLGATGVIYAPLIAVKMNPDQYTRLPDMSPWLSVEEAEMELLTVLARDVAEHAAELGVCVLWEPLNRYEQWWFNRLENGAALCDRVASDGRRIMADFFHMSIEEDSIPEALRQWGPDYVRHVHLADSNRATPGHGATDFAAAFAALEEIGFDGYMALECSPRGDRAEDMKRAADFLRAQA
ncbi:MAG: sugar phosphate isomerase/epimerase [Armatimonadetes bacterium]|nr:sugar phosphate isomerase/epimerase [Armatimonadota bacterium]